MVCGVGRIGKIPRRVAAFVIYVPPNIKSKQLEELREALATEVAVVRAAYHNPLIVVGGDFNRRDFGPALAEVDEIDLISTGPTRGDGTIDLIYTNSPGAVKEKLVLPPLRPNAGAASDHKCVYVAAEFGDDRKYEGLSE